MTKGESEAPWLLTVTFIPGMEDKIDDLSGIGVFQSWDRGIGKYEYSYSERQHADQAYERMRRAEGVYTVELKGRGE